SARDRLAAASALVGWIVVVDGWWLVRNQVLYGEPTGLSALSAFQTGNARLPVLHSPIPAVEGAVASYYHLFGGFGVGGGIDSSGVHLALAVAATVGLAVGAATALRMNTRARLILLGWPAITFLELLAYSYTTGNGDRYIFPAIAPMAVLAVSGWEAIIRRVHSV